MKGSLCKSYLLEHKIYDGVYRLIVMDQFHLPTSRYEQQQSEQQPEQQQPQQQPQQQSEQQVQQPEQ